MPDAPSPADIDALQRLIGYHFRTPDLLVTALTHRSSCNEPEAAGEHSYERLEFLGDAVIELLISDLLYHRFPAAREGELTRRRTACVNEESLAAQARELDLGRYLRLGRGEETHGGRERDSMLADCFEALTAAVYLDGGFEAGRVLVGRLFGPRLEALTAAVLHRDHKSRLQELAQSRGLPLPEYRLAGTRGPDHRRTFAVEVRVAGELMGTGQAASKKKAEQQAACAALARLDDEGARRG
ncbi:MAG: ribonuclease III [Deltaproteobacteria bacterium]|nr:ribonuclease III [Candidatus Anaeroferrophillacea bacterium]